MTANEQAIEIADRYLYGGKREQEIILSCFTEEEKAIFINFIGYYKLFQDQKYYNAIKNVVCEMCVTEFYG